MDLHSGDVHTVPVIRYRRRVPLPRDGAVTRSAGTSFPSAILSFYGCRNHCSVSHYSLLAMVGLARTSLGSWYGPHSVVQEHKMAFSSSVGALVIARPRGVAEEEQPRVSWTLNIDFSVWEGVIASRVVGTTKLACGILRIGQFPAYGTKTLRESIFFR